MSAELKDRFMTEAGRQGPDPSSGEGLGGRACVCLHSGVRSAVSPGGCLGRDDLYGGLSVRFRVQTRQIYSACSRV